MQCRQAGRQAGRPLGSRSPNLVWKAGLLSSPCAFASAATHERVYTHTRTSMHADTHRKPQSSHVNTRLLYQISRTHTVPTTHRWKHNILFEQAHSLRHTHSHKHALCDAVPQAGRPLHLPHLLCPQLNFDLSSQRQSLVCVNCVCRVFAYTRLYNQRHVAFLSIGVCYNCISPPAVDWCVFSVGMCVCLCGAAEVPAVIWCTVCWCRRMSTRWAASCCVTRQGSEGTQAWDVMDGGMCVNACVFHAISDPSSLLCGSLIRQWAGLRPCLKGRSPGLLAEHLLKDHSSGYIWGGLLSSFWSLPPSFPFCLSLCLSLSP